ncbi:TRAP transporter large permease [Albidovulum sediminicola]|uniref:TRAP transporter large permease protein n=1 Tax=Albidovulum sediminicola TaxID=2984331 RepID=A0ABT2Z5A1_9RHOB|nr:TRAP transporter large permease [Defluviimonas sp. WL0075]MCV2866304.1 TRAP transporter large permease [Defluviimonas sp. WL0075]
MLTFALVLLFALIGLSIPVAAALGLLGLSLDQLFTVMPLYRAIGDIAWSASTDFLLVAIPLFVLMGEILLRSGIADRVYRAVSAWITWLPGGIMHANIAACTAFAAISGSTVATAATIGTVAIPQMEKRKYGTRLFLGTLASGGTLGILIPPSINIIIYGALTDTSIPELYLAGILPGLILAALFSLTVVIACLIRPALGGERESHSWGERFRSLVDLVPPAIIFVIVIGSIYAGLATPTESAALGVVSSLILAAAYRRLSLAMLKASIEGAMQTTAMIMLIIVAAFFLNLVLSAIGLPQAVSAFVTELDYSPTVTLLMIVGLYVVLGLFLETLTLMITTIPIIAPVVFSLGYDPVWFGIILMLLIETALITPPVGLNLYVIQGVRGRGQVGDVIYGALPFVLALMTMILLLMALPQIALWLPNAVY